MQSTRDKILDSMISYIKEDPSISQVSMAQIAERANIGKSTVYDYFETKDALIEETYLYLLDKYQATLLKDIELKNFKLAMLEQLSLTLDVVEDAKMIMEAIMMSQNEMIIFNYKQCSRKINEIQKLMEKRFNSIFALGIEEKHIEGVFSKYTPNIIQALISGLMFQYTDGKIDIERQALLELIYQELVKVLKS